MFPDRNMYVSNITKDVSMRPTLAKVQSMEYVQSPWEAPTLHLWPEPARRDSMSEMMAELGTWEEKRYREH